MTSTGISVWTKYLDIKCVRNWKTREIKGKTQKNW